MIRLLSCLKRERCNSSLSIRMAFIIFSGLAILPMISSIMLNINGKSRHIYAWFLILGEKLFFFSFFLFSFYKVSHGDSLHVFIELKKVPTYMLRAFPWTDAVFCQIIFLSLLLRSDKFSFSILLMWLIILFSIQMFS